MAFHDRVVKRIQLLSLQPQGRRCVHGGAVYVPAVREQAFQTLRLSLRCGQRHQRAGHLCAAETFGRTGAPDVTMRLSASKLRALGWQAEVDLPEMFRRLAESFRHQEGATE